MYYKTQQVLEWLNSHNLPFIADHVTFTSGTQEYVGSTFLKYLSTEEARRLQNDLTGYLPEFKPASKVQYGGEIPSSRTLVGSLAAITADTNYHGYPIGSVVLVQEYHEVVLVGRVEVPVYRVRGFFKEEENWRIWHDRDSALIRATDMKVILPEKVSPKVAAELLKKHNAWRRGAITETQDPAALGKAIDLAVEVMSNM